MPFHMPIYEFAMYRITHKEFMTSQQNKHNPPPPPTSHICVYFISSVTFKVQDCYVQVLHGLPIHSTALFMDTATEQ